MTKAQIINKQLQPVSLYNTNQESGVNDILKKQF